MRATECPHSQSVCVHNSHKTKNYYVRMSENEEVRGLSNITAGRVSALHIPNLCLNSNTPYGSPSPNSTSVVCEQRARSKPKAPSSVLYPPHPQKPKSHQTKRETNVSCTVALPSTDRMRYEFLCSALLEKSKPSPSLLFVVIVVSFAAITDSDQVILQGARD